MGTSGCASLERLRDAGVRSNVMSRLQGGFPRHHVHERSKMVMVAIRARVSTFFEQNMVGVVLAFPFRRRKK